MATNPLVRNLVTEAAYQDMKARSIVGNFDILEGETQYISIDAISVITLIVPPYAIGATIQFVGATSADEAAFTVNGATPSDSVGYRVKHGASGDIGKTPIQPGGDTDTLANFKAIATTGSSGYVAVTYYSQR